jgi:hypothetical protein
VVVNVADEPCDVYVGPALADFPRSQWHCPFGPDDQPPDRYALFQFFEYLFSRRDLLALVPHLRGKRLGCWCSPSLCHGHVLAALADSRACREMSHSLSPSSAAGRWPDV